MFLYNYVLIVYLIGIPTGRFMSHALDVCHQPLETGRCRARFELWYYDTGRRECLQFIYGGCDGNDNRFNTRDECERQCLYATTDDTPDYSTTQERYTPTPHFNITTTGYTSTPHFNITTKGYTPTPYFNITTTDVYNHVCQQPRVTGRCRAKKIRWYYNTGRQECLKFIYGGCGGNENRFNTRTDCERQCLDSTEDDTPDYSTTTEGYTPTPYFRITTDVYNQGAPSPLKWYIIVPCIVIIVVIAIGLVLCIWRKSIKATTSHEAKPPEQADIHDLATTGSRDSEPHYYSTIDGTQPIRTDANVHLDNATSNSNEYDDATTVTDAVDAINSTDGYYRFVTDDMVHTACNVASESDQHNVYTALNHNEISNEATYMPLIQRQSTTEAYVDRHVPRYMELHA